MMKYRLLLILFLCAGFSVKVMAQDVDIPLFATIEDTIKASEERKNPPSRSKAPRIQDGLDKQKMPNIGKSAQTPEGIKVGLPVANVEFPLGVPDQPVQAPFSGKAVTQPMKYSTDDASGQVVRAKQQAVKLDDAVTGIAPVNAQVKTETEEPTVIPVTAVPQQPTISKPKVAPKTIAAITKDVMPAVPDVSKFVVLGLALYMTPDQVADVAMENGLEINFQSYSIPLFMTTRFENECRADGLRPLHLIHECARDKAKDVDMYYTSQLTVQNKATREQAVVQFSSPLTGNKAYKIDYTAAGDNSLGTSYKDTAKKTRRRDTFWNLVYDSYGRPNYAQNQLWGDPRGAYMQAFMSGNALDAWIVLEDKNTPFDDADAAFKQEEDKPQPHSFTFMPAATR